MRIIETFICYSVSTSCFVKVHRCRDLNSNNVYYKESSNGFIEKLSDEESNVLLTNN
jgi:hypothetical protein